MYFSPIACACTVLFLRNLFPSFVIHALLYAHAVSTKTTLTRWKPDWEKAANEFAEAGAFLYLTCRIQNMILRFRVLLHRVSCALLRYLFTLLIVLCGFVLVLLFLSLLYRMALQ